MRKLFFIVGAVMLAAFVFSQGEVANDAVADVDVEDLPPLHYRHGTVVLRGGMARIVLPAGFKYLDAEQAETVLVSYWGNPRYSGMTLGFIVPEAMDAASYDAYVFNIEYEGVGYVSDADAGKIDFDDLLRGLQSDTDADNVARAAAGYDAVRLIGWASSPYYDSDRKALHWAKELVFGNDDDDPELNYNIRLLGRRGMLAINALAPMSSLAEVKADIPSVLGMIEFTEGNRYSDYVAGADAVSQWTVGGLISGKLSVKRAWYSSVLVRVLFIVISLAVICGLAFYFLRIRRRVHLEAVGAFDADDAKADAWEAAHDVSVSVEDIDDASYVEVEEIDENDKPQEA